MPTGITPPYQSNVVAQVSSQMQVNVYTDVALQMDSGQSITASPAPTATLVDEAGQVDVSAASLVLPVTVSGTKLVVIVKALTAGHEYRLTFTYLPTPPDFAGQQLGAIQPISCKY
jgi:hypothetical protein